MCIRGYPGRVGALGGAVEAGLDADRGVVGPVDLDDALGVGVPRDLCLGGAWSGWGQPSHDIRPNTMNPRIALRPLRILDAADVEGDPSVYLTLELGILRGEPRLVDSGEGVQPEVTVVVDGDGGG
jgi:hypothetical protein